MTRGVGDGQVGEGVQLLCGAAVEASQIHVKVRREAVSEAYGVGVGGADGGVVGDGPGGEDFAARGEPSLHRRGLPDVAGAHGELGCDAVFGAQLERLPNFEIALRLLRDVAVIGVVVAVPEAHLSIVGQLIIQAQKGRLPHHARQAEDPAVWRSEGVAERALVLRRRAGHQRILGVSGGITLGRGVVVVRHAVPFGGVVSHAQTELVDGPDDGAEVDGVSRAVGFERVLEGGVIISAEVVALCRIEVVGDVGHGDGGAEEDAVGDVHRAREIVLHNLSTFVNLHRRLAWRVRGPNAAAVVGAKTAAVDVVKIFVPGPEKARLVAEDGEPIAGEVIIRGVGCQFVF